MLLNVSIYLSSRSDVSQVHLKLAAVICAAKQSIFVPTFLGHSLLLLWAARLCLPTPDTSCSGQSLKTTLCLKCCDCRLQLGALTDKWN